MPSTMPPARATRVATELPYRGRFGAVRPDALAGLPLPPAPMPAHLRRRPLKAWRYVGVYGPEFMLCAASVRIGAAGQSFWALWDRAGRRLYACSAMHRRAVSLRPGRVQFSDARVAVDLALVEEAGIEAVCRSGAAYGWTRKQGGIAAQGTVTIDGVERPWRARAIVDDTAAYYERHTRWQWSAGVGQALDGRQVAWNLVAGVNDPRHNSERTIWIDGRARELGPVAFAADLSAVGDLRFAAEAVRAQNQNLLIVRSRYRQPFGVFSGQLDGIALAEGYGVMEDHDVWW